MIKVTLPSKEEVKKLNKNMQIARMTDFSILLGGTSNSFTDLTSDYWTRDFYFKYSALVVTFNNYIIRNSFSDRTVCIRPIISLEDVDVKSGAYSFFYGEYPQTIVDEKLSVELEQEYKNGNINATDKTYTTDSENYENMFSSFKSRTHIEYQYKENKYIRFKADRNCIGKKLSNGIEIKKDDIYWVKVEPIEWLIDNEQNIAISRNLLLSGIQFDDFLSDWNYEFEHTFISRFLDEYFSKDMITTKNIDEKSKIRSK